VLPTGEPALPQNWKEKMNQNKSVQIEKAENGWIVRIHRHPSQKSEEWQKQQLKTMAKIIALLSKISGKEQARGIDEELEPWKETEDEISDTLREVEKIIDTSFEIQKEEKEEETYIFTDLSSALNFVRDFLQD